MKISYAIPVCNELKEIQRLLGFLMANKRNQDEIIVLYDTKNGTKEVESFLDHYNQLNSNVMLPHIHNLNYYYFLPHHQKLH